MRDGFRLAIYFFRSPADWLAGCNRWIVTELAQLRFDPLRSWENRTTTSSPANWYSARMQHICQWKWNHKINAERARKNLSTIILIVKWNDGNVIGRELWFAINRPSVSHDFQPLRVCRKIHILFTFAYPLISAPFDSRRYKNSIKKNSRALRAVAVIVATAVTFPCHSL